MNRTRNTIWLVVKAIITIALIALQFFVHSPLYHAVSALVAVLLWTPDMMRLIYRRFGPLRWLFLLVPIAIATIAGFMLPRRGFDASQRLNMMVMRGNTLTEPSAKSYLMQCLVPEQELIQQTATGDTLNGIFRPAMSGKVAQRLGNEQPVYIIQPAQVDSGMKYHLVAITQDSADCRRIDMSRLNALDDCIVVTLGARDTAGKYTTADLDALTKHIIPALKQRGLATDSCMMTLIDTTPDGVLANAAARQKGRQWRNIVWMNAHADTTDTIVAHARLVLAGNNKDYEDAYECWRDNGYETDLLEADKPDEALALIHQIIDGTSPVSQSRLERALDIVDERDLNEQYVMFVDYSIPSGKFRFFIYDYEHKRYAVISKCGHGCGPGNTDERPIFSNEPGSCCASLGNFEVQNIIAMPKNGRIAILIDGLDPTNDNAKGRGLMIHGGMKKEGEIYPEYIHIGILSEGCVALSDIPFAYTVAIKSGTDDDILLQAYD